MAERLLVGWECFGVVDKNVLGDKRGQAISADSSTQESSVTPTVRAVNLLATRIEKVAPLVRLVVNATDFRPTRHSGTRLIERHGSADPATLASA
jgi:hypothetical protein